ncbi:hypothetical protein GCM10009839_19220 [Catenulispora yoronensis]|uniref:Uncharacterized protein n=1 Tax=Catenulispora yoronensis TaxID=450799 RepID=A0ABN2TXB8_9ACTN
MRKTLIVVGSVAAAAVVVYFVIFVSALHHWSNTSAKNKSAAEAEVDAAAHTVANQLSAALRSSPQDLADMAAIAPQGVNVTIGAQSAPGSLTLTIEVTKAYVSPPLGLGNTGHCYKEVLVANEPGGPAALTEISCLQMAPLITPGQVISAP